MDKDTLNEFMFIVVVLLLGTVFLLFATPFGDMLSEFIATPVIQEIDEFNEPVDIGDNMGAPNMINYGD